MIFSKPRWTIFVGFLLLTLLSVGGLRLFAQEPISKEYQVKAVFLFNFAQFVKWPIETFTTPDQPFCIGILGQDPFGPFMDATVQGEKVDGHPIVIQRFASAMDVKDCQILFISASQETQLPSLLASLQGKSILTVSDSEGFIRNGGMIRFFTKDNKIHLRVNLDAAKRAYLSISSQMLLLAEIVEVGGN